MFTPKPYPGAVVILKQTKTKFATSVAVFPQFAFEGDPGRILCWSEAQGYHGMTQKEIQSKTILIADVQIEAALRASIVPLGWDAPHAVQAMNRFHHLARQLDADRQAKEPKAQPAQLVKKAKPVEARPSRTFHVKPWGPKVCFITTDLDDPKADVARIQYSLPKKAWVASVPALGLVIERKTRQDAIDFALDALQESDRTADPADAPKTVPVTDQGRPYYHGECPHGMIWSPCPKCDAQDDVEVVTLPDVGDPVKALPRQRAAIVYREDWLNAIAYRMADWFNEQGRPLPTYRIAMGLPGRKKAIGVCYTDEASADSHHEVFISPLLDDPMDVAATLCHELAHAAVGIKEGHSPKTFGKLVRALGLEGKLTATTAGDLFRERCQPILDEVGPLPHAKLDLNRAKGTGPKKQGTRMIKLECPECGYTARTTKKWLDDVGPAHCPKHGPMNPDDPEAKPAPEGTTVTIKAKRILVDPTGDQVIDAIEEAFRNPV